MSKLAEKLKRIHQGPVSALGFHRSAEVAIPPMLIIANLSKSSLAEVKAKVGAGIDAGIIHGEGADTKALAQLTKAMNGAPLGLLLESTDKTEISEFIDLGYDFVVFGLSTPYAALEDKEPGKILKIEATLDQGLVRAINRLPFTVDGVLLSVEDGAVTIERLLVYQRFAELLERPLLVPASSPLSEGELKGLADSGIDGLWLAGGLSKESINDMKKAIGGLSKSTRPKARTAALLPRVSAELESEVEEEEEEDL